jgi:hypothetical protein
VGTHVPWAPVIHSRYLTLLLFTPSFPLGNPPSPLTPSGFSEAVNYVAPCGVAQGQADQSECLSRIDMDVGCWRRDSLSLSPESPPLVSGLWQPSLLSYEEGLPQDEANEQDG